MMTTKLAGVSGAALSRRAMRGAVLAAFAVVAVAGCGSVAPSSAKMPPRHTFIDLVSELPNDLDETGTPDPASTEIISSWTSELVRPRPAREGPNAVLAPDDAVVPYLATAWQREPDGSYIFDLRRGVRGVSGNPFTAADVAWSLQRAIARSPVAPFLFALGNIDTRDPVTILDSHRVRVNVTAPSPFTLSVLASYDAGIYDSALYRSHATASDPWGQSWGRTHSASFGAYWVSAFVPRRYIVLEANPGFWRRPYYTRVVINELVSSPQRLAAVEAGSATHTSGLDWGDFESASDTGGSDDVTARVLADGPGLMAWHLNVGSGPLANPLVRQALNLGLNRIELANAIDDGFDTPDSLSIPAAFGERQPTTFDPEQSRSLLRAAGYTPGKLTIDVYTNEAETGGEAGTVVGFLTQDLLQIGVNLRVVYLNDTDQLLALEQDPGLESTIDSITPVLGGAGVLLEQDANRALDPVSLAAEQRYSSAPLQALLDELRDSPGGAAADTLIDRAATILDTDLPTINLVTIPVQNVTRSNVTGYEAYADPVTYYENLHPTG